jgi:TolB protein
MTSARHIALVKSLQICVLLCLAGCVAPSPLGQSLWQETIACYVAHDASSDDACWPATVYIMRGDGTQRREVGDGVEPSWAPDGDQLVVVSTCTDTLLVLDVESGDAMPLFAAGGWVEGPAWSPDGGAIAFNFDNYNLFVINEDGSGVRQLTDYELGLAVGTPSWSHSGDKIAYALGRSDGSVPLRELPRDIWVVDGDGDAKVKLTDGAGFYYNPIWSPVQDTIAFNSHSNGEDHIMLMNADGSEQRRIGSGFLYGWSPDGTRIYFGMPGDEALWTMNSDGSSRTRLFELDCENPVWSPVIEG